MTPDTSPKAVVATLRDEANGYRDSATAYRKRAAELAALADALDQQAAVSGPAFQGALTKDEWQTRYARAALAYGEVRSYAPLQLSRALRAFVPELAPSDD